MSCLRRRLLLINSEWKVIETYCFCFGKSFVVALKCALNHPPRPQGGRITTFWALGGHFLLLLFWYRSQAFTQSHTELPTPSRRCENWRKSGCYIYYNQVTLQLHNYDFVLVFFLNKLRTALEGALQNKKEKQNGSRWEKRNQDGVSLGRFLIWACSKYFISKYMYWIKTWDLILDMDQKT